MRKIAFCFTLAEVLIVISVIGVIAAITIPTLINTISKNAKKAKIEVIENRFLDGLNIYNTMEHGLSKNYSNTKEFVDGLSKYHKMLQICGSENMKDCFPYRKISFNSDNGVEQIEISELKSVKNIGLKKDEYLEPAAFINSQGIPFLISIKKYCPTDSEQAMRSISECIVGFYDINGAKTPNKYGLIKDDSNNDVAEADIIPINGGKVANSYFAKINGIKILDKVFYPSDIVSGSTYDCATEVTKNYGITTCPTTNNNDLWGQAMYYCHQMDGKLISDDESTRLARGLFINSENKHPTQQSWSNDYKIDTALANKIGLYNMNRSALSQSYIDVRLWVSGASSNGLPVTRIIGVNYITGAGNGRNSTFAEAVCVEK